MYYFFKPHEKNFKEWVKSRFIGIPESGIVFLKYITSKQFNLNLELFSEKQGWKYKIIIKGRQAFYKKI